MGCHTVSRGLSTLVTSLASSQSLILPQLSLCRLTRASPWRLAAHCCLLLLSQLGVRRPTSVGTACPCPLYSPPPPSALGRRANEVTRHFHSGQRHGRPFPKRHRLNVLLQQEIGHCQQYFAKRGVDVMASSKSMVMPFHRKTMALEKAQRWVAKTIK